jgi:hypothetical protein
VNHTAPVYRGLTPADLLDIVVYNEEKPHQGRWCFGKTPLQTFLDAIPDCEGKNDRCLTTIGSEPAISKRTPSVRSNTSYYKP